MTREELKEAAKVMEAYANGKKIQCNYNCQDNEGWVDTDNPSFNWDKYAYRIKPEPKYRPFETQEECWQEMHQHPDFGWVLAKDSKIMYHICVVGIGYVLIDSMSPIFSEAFAEYKFTDGTPFGIKEE